MTSQKRNIKKSDLSWLKQLPQNWDVLPNRAIFKERNTRNTIDERLLSVTIKKGVISQSSMIQQSSKKDSSNEDKSKYKLVLPGDIVYNKMRMWQGAVGYSNLRGIVSPAYIVLRSSRDIYPKYFHYLFRSPAYSKECHKYSHGICDDQMSLRFEDFKTIMSILPPIEEQQAIVRFLDYKCAQINKFIQKKKRLIELLKEQKQVIINQTVARGLDPNVRLKPSGVDWLGDIPEHWEIKKLKYLMRNHAEQIGNKSDDEVYIALEHVESETGKLNLPDEEVPFESLVKKFAAGDILFGKLRPYLAKVIQTAQKGVCVGEFLVLRRIDSNLSNNFLEILLRSKRIIDIITASTFGAKMPRADWNFIGNLPIAYPFKDEQLKIATYLKNKTKKIENGIEALSQQIDLIQEYRTRLISDVVTGQIDVRNIEFSDIPVNELIEEALEEEQEEQSLELVGAGDDD